VLRNRCSCRSRARAGLGVALPIHHSTPDFVLLAGDIGGTNTRLAIYRDDEGPLTLVHMTSYQSRSFSTLEDIVLRFLATNQFDKPSAACFAVAGAVVSGAVRATNLPWQMSEQELGQRLGIPRVLLMNDLQAAAHGVVATTDDPASLLPLQPGQVSDDHGARVLVSAGTGLGVASSIRSRRRRAGTPASHHRMR
jgi:glucokinase